MELLLLVFFCLLTGSEVTFGAENEPEVITVDEGSDVILPCSFNTEDITNKKFEWKTDGRQVFLYDDENHSNNAITGQDQQFIRRVEHFPDKLKSGDASITIRDTKVTDKGLYTCAFPNLQPSQIFYVNLLVFEAKVIRVIERSDVILPCSLNTTDITTDKFQWKKDGHQVFLYDAGYHSNNAGTGQDQQFIQRVEHFPDELKSGNASITIRSTKVTDSGDYTCEFPDLNPRQIFQMKLLVVAVPAKPYVRIVKQTQRVAELQCEVRGAFPKPELHWEDGDGNILTAEEPQEIERGIRYDVILITTVTKTDIYRCVATQKEINHQTHDDIDVYFPGLTDLEIAGIVIAVGVVGVIVAAVLVFVVYKWRYRIINCFMRDASPKPSVRIYHQTPRAAVLQCEVRGAFPKPKLYWEDREGVLPAPEPEVTERGGHYDIILKTVVYKTGNYRCVATQEAINYQAHADIHVHFTGKTIIIMEEGSDVILPCSLGSRPDITNKKFVWKKGGCLMFLYDNGPVNDNNQTQDQQFKGRVSHFRDELKSGNASIIIRHMKKADTGNYTCEFPDLQPSQTFHIELVLEPTAPNPSGNGPAQDGNDGDGGDDEPFIPSNGNQPTNEDSRV